MVGSKSEPTLRCFRVAGWWVQQSNSPSTLLDGGVRKQTHELTHEKVVRNLFMGYTMLAH
jgi:hypothetical protein